MGLFFAGLWSAGLIACFITSLVVGLVGLTVISTILLLITAFCLGAYANSEYGF